MGSGPMGTIGSTDSERVLTDSNPTWSFDGSFCKR